MKIKTLFATLALLLLGSVAYAQTPPPATSYDLQITGAASSTYSFAANTVSCNQAEPGTAGTVNPRFLVWTDELNAGRVCFHDTGANTGPLFALPIGDYSAVLYAVNTTGSVVARSDPSNSVSFSRLVKPAARTGFHVRGAS